MISIVTCCYSDERLGYIKSLIDSVKLQTMPCELLLIVEKDWHLAEMIQEYSSLPEVIYEPEKIGLAKARNLGIERTRGNIVAFVDDDASLAINWSEQLEIAFHAQNCAGIAGRIEPIWERAGDSHYPKSLYWVIGCDISREPKDECFGHGTNMAFKKTELPRFNDKFTVGGKTKGGYVGDDVDLQLRMKMKMLYNPSILIFHQVPHYKVSLNYLAHYAYWQGASEKRFSKLYPGVRGTKRKDSIKNNLKELSPKTFTALLCAGLGYILQ